MTINTQAFLQGYLHEKTAASPDSVVGKPRRTQKGNIVPDPAPAPPSEQQPLGPIDPPYSFRPGGLGAGGALAGAGELHGKLKTEPLAHIDPYSLSTNPLNSAIKPSTSADRLQDISDWMPGYDGSGLPGEHKTRPHRGIPGSSDPGLTRKQWYDNAMSQRYNKGQISEQEYLEYANPKSTGAAKTLRDILGGAKHIAKRYGEDFMKGTPGTAGTAADRTLEGTAADLEERRKRGQ